MKVNTNLSSNHALQLMPAMRASYFGSVPFKHFTNIVICFYVKLGLFKTNQIANLDQSRTL